MDLFSRLLTINSFEFKSSSGEKSQTGWSGSGKGKVITTREYDTIYFKEEGVFKLDGTSKQNKISNEYVWQQISPSKISLSHARFGYNNLVKLFDLKQIDETTWQSIQPHICIDDLYIAKLKVLDNCVELIWEITGPKKDEVIRYKYSSKELNT
ncbi:hypothetical protein LO80_05855 [Candidatus Francisella endociliophora]|uniref:DUF6314 domain-containing protein n=1 Tax=Candidatus Francisella endociliophora TaxID=653937 RepID=A0A097EPP0_9GAMM|nr:DUF6314 family protein [Francisella sp. FSC1006]AIT09537.1 hypothetical protein LO80_05855 [Francisella sp. FSC1006]